MESAVLYSLNYGGKLLNVNNEDEASFGLPRLLRQFL